MELSSSLYDRALSQSAATGLNKWDLAAGLARQAWVGAIEPRRPCGRCLAAEDAKIAGEMRLVGVARIDGDGRPAVRAIGARQRTGAMKAQHLRKCLRRNADLVLEAAGEMFSAPADVGGDVADPDLTCAPPEHLNRRGDRRRRFVHRAAQHKVFHDLEAPLPPRGVGNHLAEAS